MIIKNNYLYIACAILMVLILSGCSLQKDIIANKYSSQANTRYQVALERQVIVDLNGSNDQTDPQKMTENLDMVMTCQPQVKRDDNSMSYKLSFESIQSKRTDFVQTGRFADSTAGLLGKSFTITFTQEGKLVSPQLEKELKNLAADSFEEVKRPGARYKQADFLTDIWAIQTLLFDAIAAADKPSFQTTSQIPFPITDIAGPVTQAAWLSEKDTSGIVIKGSEQLNNGMTQNPMPQFYSGQYKMEGLLGYLRHCRYESVDGRIACRFNEDSQLPQDIAMDRTIKAAADYILTQNNPHSEITVRETLKISKQN